jgi:hypothetical protein
VQFLGRRDDNGDRATPVSDEHESEPAAGDDKDDIPV